MSLNVSLTAVRTMKVIVFDETITHRFKTMADEVGIYFYLWRPDVIGIKTAGELIKPLKRGLKKLIDDPDYYKQFDPPDDWGNYNDLVIWLEKYIQACEKNPDAVIWVSR